jgi:hypothetical protein
METKHIYMQSCYFVRITYLLNIRANVIFKILANLAKFYIVANRIILYLFKFNNANYITKKYHNNIDIMNLC